MTATTMKRREVQLESSLDSQVQSFADRAGLSFSDVARQALTSVTYEPGPYSFNGCGPSLVRDIWACAHTNDADAQHRIEAFRQWNRDLAQQFAANTTNAAAVIPPGYQSSPFAGVLVADRPLVDAATTVDLANAQPFTVPGPVTASGATAAHTEGTNPTPGSLDVDPITLSPKGFSGEFQVTRELVDSSNPAVDAIALTAMRESFAGQTETVVYTELNGANGQGGTITSGLVPSGAQVSTVSGDGAALAAGLKTTLAAYPFARKRKARTGIVSAEAAAALAPVLDERTGDEQVMWRVQGAGINPGPAMTGNTAGDADVFVLSDGDLWVWQSPVLQFEFAERNGPANIDLALFGYFATRLLRPVGLAAIRYTPA